MPERAIAGSPAPETSAESPSAKSDEETELYDAPGSSFSAVPCSYFTGLRRRCSSVLGPASFMDLLPRQRTAKQQQQQRSEVREHEHDKLPLLSCQCSTVPGRDCLLSMLHMLTVG